MFKLTYPYAFIIVLLPLITRQFKAKSIQQLKGLKIPFFREASTIKVSIIPGASYFNKLVLFTLWLLLCFALTAPKWVDSPIELPRKGRDLLLAIDVSGSMETPDMYLKGRAVDRLTVVKQVANDFIANRTGDRLGLILFGTRAYLQTPLTFDRKTVKHMVDDTSIKLAGPLTAIGDAIGLSVKRLRNIDSESKVLILLTDGANNSGAVEPKKAANMAASYGIKIYTIGLGAEKLKVPGIFGPQTVNPSIELDEETLREIAKTTGGKFFRAMSVEDLQTVYQSIDRLEPNDKESGAYSPEYDLFHWPLALALFCSLVLLIRNMIPIGRRF